MSDGINITFLRDVDHGENPSQPKNIADLIAKFIGSAQKSVHIAIYDFRFSDKEGQLSTPVVDAIKKAAENNVEVRIVTTIRNQATKQTNPSR